MFRFSFNSKGYNNLCLAHGSAHARPSAKPHIGMSGNLLDPAIPNYISYSPHNVQLQ
jgi:hypothetical protein